MLLWGIGAGLKARFAPVLTNKDATGWIRVSEKTSSRQFGNSDSPCCSARRKLPF
jgi:hypothetical protein